MSSSRPAGTGTPAVGPPTAQELMLREAAWLAPYAMPSMQSQGRRYPEPEHPYRTPYQRDRDRITHSAAYRRLSYKTQVFTGEMGQQHRTRLTHTLEVASIARTLGRALRLNEDLIEALALVHDLGHPPFGHAGEQALQQCLGEAGSFSHNQHALTLVEHLERRYPAFPGLNLTWEVLHGQGAKAQQRLLDQGALLEVQVVDAADNIAYDTHDADDALTLGLLQLDDLTQLDLWRHAQAAVRRRWTIQDRLLFQRAVVRQLIDTLVGDLLRTTWDNLRRHEVSSRQDVARLGRLVHPSAEIAEQQQALERFLFQHVYRHPQLLAMRKRACEMIHACYEQLLPRVEELSQPFQERAARHGPAQAVAEYLACLTDEELLQLAQSPRTQSLPRR